MSRIADRIVPNSKHHWVIFVLNAFESRRDEPATAENIYELTGQLLPSPEYIEEALEELCRRHLVTYTNNQYVMHNNGRVALAEHGKPENAPWAREVPTVDKPDEAGDDVFADLIELEYEGVFTDQQTVNLTENETSHVGPNIYRDARDLHDALEPYGDYRVYVRAGPWRLHDVAYAFNSDDKYVLLDYYSVRPGHQYIDRLITEVADEAATQAKWEVPEDE